MKPFTYISLFFIATLFISCMEKKTNLNPQNSKSNKVVLISINAPKKYVHLLKQDSVGKKLKDSLGPKTFWVNNGFKYLDHMNNIQTWQPKSNVSDTITIETYNDYLELSTNNFFTSIKETFLVKNGDTVIFNYEHNIPVAIIKNREVNDVELNYNNYRLKKLFDNKYTSHYLIFGNLFLGESIEEYEQKSIDYFNQAKLDYKKEVELLDSLKNNNAITEINYLYRLDALNMLMEKHKKLKH